MSDNPYSAPTTPAVELQAPEPGSIARGAWSAIAIYLVGTVFTYLFLVMLEVLRVTEGNFTWERAGEMLEKMTADSWVESASLVLERVTMVFAVMYGTRIAARNTYLVAWIVGSAATIITLLVIWASEYAYSLPYLAVVTVTPMCAALLGAWLALRKDASQR